jgi:hypothetical protein
MQKIYTQKEIGQWELTNDPLMDELLYENRPGIRKSGINIRITDREMITLYECNENPVSFIHRYGIVYPGGHRCKPILHVNQEKILLDHEIKRFYPVALPRQSGLTSSIEFMALHDIVFKGRDVIIACNTMERSAYIIEKVMEMYAELPFYMKPGVDRMEKFCVRFENGGRITAWPPVTAFPRNIDSLFVDDFQYMDRKKREYILHNWLPTMTCNISTRVFIGTSGEIPKELRDLEDFAMFMADDIDWLRVK